MGVTWLDALYVILPSVLSYSVTFICRVDDAGADVKFRPPGWFFAVIWPILFLCIGFSWAIAARTSTNYAYTVTIYTLLSVGLAAWIITYGCGKSSKWACWVLVLDLAIAFACFTQGNNWSKLLLAPLLAWSIFALGMNAAEVQLKGA